VSKRKVKDPFSKGKGHQNRKSYKYVRKTSDPKAKKTNAAWVGGSKGSPGPRGTGIPKKTRQKSEGKGSEWGGCVNPKKKLPSLLTNHHSSSGGSRRKVRVRETLLILEMKKQKKDETKDVPTSHRWDIGFVGG